MSTTYERAPKAIEAMVQHALEKYHPELHKQGVTVDVMIARAYDKDECEAHALKMRGYPIDAKTQITSLQDRARGIADAKLVIDAFNWNVMSDRRKSALIDHELEHLDLVAIKPTKKNGFEEGWKRDDLGRPKLKSRPHDWELVGFKDVVERHGENSHEAAQFAAFRDEYGQLNMFGPNVLQIAENGKKAKSPTKAVEDALRKVLKPGKGIDKVTISAGGVSVSSDDVTDLSRACARRHHKECTYKDCQCDCGHPGRKEQKNAEA